MTRMARIREGRGGGLSFQPRRRSCLEVADFDFEPALALVFVEARGEGDGADAAGAHQFFRAFGHTEADGLDALSLLLDAEAQMALADADLFGYAGDLHGAGE